MSNTESLASGLERNAKTFAANVAVAAKGAKITYAELDAYSNRIANFAAANGAASGDRIGIYMEKSIDTVAALFGALKAGCAYVPLDPTSPVERTSYIARNCGLKGIFTDQNKLAAALEVAAQNSEVAFVACLTAGFAVEDAPAGAKRFGREAVDRFPSEPSGRAAAGGDPAYILYTSGSTGRPKGVTLTHKNALEFVNWSIAYFGITSTDRLSSHAPFHFDLSILDIYAALGTGAQLCLVPSGISYFPTSLAKFIEDAGITVWYSVPSILVQMAQYGELEQRDLSSLRTVIYAGEVFQYPFLNLLRTQLPRARIVNLYGPTETNVITYYDLADGPAELTENVPIGKPCPYVEALIVDESNRPVPQGQPGELIVQCTTLMPGYWNDPEKTRKVIKPVTIGGATRDFYFTGDIVEQRADGNLIYRNRRDHMVKVRGFRVELGEVEAALAALEGVLEGVVVAVPDMETGNRLVAFVTLKAGSALTPESVKQGCGKHVPLYMVPEAVTILPELPKTSTGKIDRVKLAQSGR
ncbi:MAG TPA: amino acid adenylation domain-containing protein [Bdellovibrionales bacterium]|nr:amino acid adenylation domain-containing protein [Bdellovibrionales bacterium]